MSCLHMLSLSLTHKKEKQQTEEKELNERMDRRHTAGREIQSEIKTSTNKHLHTHIYTQLDMHTLTGSTHTCVFLAVMYLWVITS